MNNNDMRGRRPARRPDYLTGKGAGSKQARASYGRRRGTGREIARRDSSEIASRNAEIRALREQKKEAEWQQDVERVRGGVDKIMLAIVLLLVTFGAIMVFSASYPTALSESGNGFTYLKKHLVFVAIGGVFMTVAALVPYRKYKKWGPFFAYGVSMLLLLAVLVIGTSEGEAKRWIYIGSFSVQPSEVMKVSLVLVLAWYIDKYRDKMKNCLTRREKYRYNVLYPFLFIVPACFLVMLEKHLSGTVILALLGVAVMLVGGCDVKQTVITSLILGAGAVGGFIATHPYALKRLTTFTAENVDIHNEGWQTFQGVLAIGSGGLFGLGFGQSNQKYSYVSMAHNDFIFSIWCEELGFIGAVLLIALFVAFIWRGYVIAMRAPDTFSTLTVFGIVTQVGVQAFLNMMVVCDIIPNTGISLPFISYGGSSLIMLMAEMGIVLSISRQSYRKISSS